MAWLTVQLQVATGGTATASQPAPAVVLATRTTTGDSGTVTSDQDRIRGTLQVTALEAAHGVAGV